MKKLFLLLALILAPLFVVAQEIPQTPWAGAMPRFTGTNVDYLVVYWEKVSFSATFTDAGFVTNMVVQFDYMEDEPAHNKTFYFPAEEGKSLLSVKGWEAFAKKARSQFLSVGEDLYAETEPYTLVGKSISVSGFEIGGGTLIFQGTNGFRAIPCEEWLGKLPSEGEKVYLGRQEQGEQKFFPVTKVGNEFLISPSLLKEFAREEAEARAREKLFREESSVVVLPSRSEEKK